MIEDFEGNLPEIGIDEIGGIFIFTCKETGADLMYPCSILSDNCWECLGSNTKFIRYYEDNVRCSCGNDVDFGFFIVIYCLERAGLLSEDFKIQCCKCRKLYKRLEVVK